MVTSSHSPTEMVSLVGAGKEHFGGALRVVVVAHRESGLPTREHSKPTPLDKRSGMGIELREHKGFGRGGNTLAPNIATHTKQITLPVVEVQFARPRGVDLVELK